MKLLDSMLPLSLPQQQIFPIHLSSVEIAIRKLKYNSISFDGISTKDLNVDCPALLQHLQLVFKRVNVLQLFLKVFIRLSGSPAI